MNKKELISEMELSFLESLPFDLIRLIIVHLDDVDIPVITAASRMLHQVAKRLFHDKWFWSLRYFTRYQETSYHPKNISSLMIDHYGWKTLYYSVENYQAPTDEQYVDPIGNLHAKINDRMSYIINCSLYQTLFLGRVNNIVVLLYHNFAREVRYLLVVIDEDNTRNSYSFSLKQGTIVSQVVYVYSSNGGLIICQAGGTVFVGVGEQQKLINLSRLAENKTLQWKDVGLEKLAPESIDIIDINARKDYVLVTESDVTHCTRDGSKLFSHQR